VGEWSSLGGFGNVNARMPLPVGKTDNTGALGMIMQALLRGAKPPQHTPEDEDPEIARLLAEAFGMAPQPMPDPAMRGY
jgi:hypothetical protein